MKELEAQLKAMQMAEEAKKQAKKAAAGGNKKVRPLDGTRGITWMV